MTDPLVSAARYMFDRFVEDMRSAIRGVSMEALNWRPAGDETNSIAVITVHAITSTRTWLSVAVGAPEPERDRDAEFRVVAADEAELLAILDRFGDDCRTVLAVDHELDWGAVRAPHRRPFPAPEPITAGWALLHALEHLREHVAHLQLTRQLWDARQR